MVGSDNLYETLSRSKGVDYFRESRSQRPPQRGVGCVAKPYPDDLNAGLRIARAGGEISVLADDNRANADRMRPDFGVGRSCEPKFQHMLSFMAEGCQMPG